MADLQHIEHTVEAACEAVVADAVAYVKAHPQYGPIVAALGEKAIQALMQGL
jgi:carbon monoxide dehydrogenase subunit G